VIITPNARPAIVDGNSGNNFDAAMMEHSAATDGTMS